MLLEALADHDPVWVVIAIRQRILGSLSLVAYGREIAENGVLHFLPRVQGVRTHMCLLLNQTAPPVLQKEPVAVSENDADLFYTCKICRQSRRKKRYGRYGNHRLARKVHVYLTK